MTSTINNELEELFHTIGASFLIITLYTICLYILEPIADNLLSWYVSNYVSFLDNGHSVNNVTIIQMILRAILAIICSGYVGFIAGTRIFPKQNRRHTISLTIVLVILVPVILLGMRVHNV